MGVSKAKEDELSIQGKNYWFQGCFALVIVNDDNVVMYICTYHNIYHLFSLILICLQTTLSAPIYQINVDAFLRYKFIIFSRTIVNNVSLHSYQV